MPKVFCFNIAWSGEEQQSVEELLNLMMLTPNTFDPFTLFK